MKIVLENALERLEERRKGVEGRGEQATGELQEAQRTT